MLSLSQNRNDIFTVMVMLLIGIFMPSNDSKAVVQNLPASNSYFTGRAKELSQLSNLLNKNKKVLVIGASGIGKSQLIKAFAYNKYQEYEIIWWFDSSKSLDQQFLSLGVQLELHDNKQNSTLKIENAPLKHIALYVKNILQDNRSSWLIIFDNINSIDAIKDFLPEITLGATKHHLILISQNSNIFNTKLYLNSFTRSDALAFLSKSLPSESTDELNKLAMLLFDYPLALAQASAYINANGISIKSYLLTYQKDYMSLLNKEHQMIQNDATNFDLERKTINSTLLMSLEQVEKESKTAMLLLQILSLIDLKLVKESILADTMKNLGKSEDEFKSTIRMLKKYSLIDQQVAGGVYYYFIHDAVKNLITLVLD